MKFEPLAKTALELFGASVSKFANKFTSYSIDSSLIIDVAANVTTDNSGTSERERTKRDWNTCSKNIKQNS